MYILPLCFPLNFLICSDIKLIYLPNFCLLCIAGFGLGLSYIPLITVLGMYFDKKRNIAIGFAVSGCGVGMFLYPPLIRFFIQHFGWRGTMLLLGAISLNLCVIGALLRPFVSRLIPGFNEVNREETQTQVLKEINNANNHCSVENLKQVHKNTIVSGSVISLDDGLASRVSMCHTLSAKPEKYVEQHKANKTGLFNFFIFKNVSYQLLCVNNFFMCFGLSIVYVHLSAYATTTGISSNLSALLFSVIGASNFLGRIAFGILGHVERINHIVLYSIAFLASGVTTLLCPISKTYGWLAFFAGLFGFLTGSFGALLPQCIIQILSLEYLASGYGYLLVFEAAGNLLGAPVGGLSL